MNNPNEKNMPMEIYCTRDYSLFHFAPDQRALEANHVIKIQKSMEKRGFIPSLHIVVDKSFSIRDGQHRFQAARNLELPIYYVFEDLHIQDVRELALSVRKWKLEDYITSYIRQGNEDYRKIRDYWRESKISCLDTFLRCGVWESSWSKYRNEFLEGRWQLTPRAKARVENFLRYYELFRDSFAGSQHRNFVTALAALFAHPLYDHKRMEKKMEYLSLKLVKCPDTKSYVNLLEWMYNYNSDRRFHVHFEYGNGRG